MIARFGKASLREHDETKLQTFSQYARPQHGNVYTIAAVVYKNNSAVSKMEGKQPPEQRTAPGDEDFLYFFDERSGKADDCGTIKILSA